VSIIYAWNCSVQQLLSVIFHSTCSSLNEGFCDRNMSFGHKMCIALLRVWLHSVWLLNSGTLLYGIRQTHSQLNFFLSAWRIDNKWQTRQFCSFNNAGYMIHNWQKVTSDMTEQVSHQCRWIHVLCHPSGCIEYCNLDFKIKHFTGPSKFSLRH